MQNLHEVVVKGVRAPKNAPFAVANIKSSELQKFATSGKEMPFLFSRTPGVLAWSENGMGTGAAYMRMRGAGGSRIIDNTQSSERSIPSYSQTDLAFNYTSKVSKALGMKQVTLGIDFNNIFNRHYAASGYVYYDWYNEGKRTSTLAYIPGRLYLPAGVFLVVAWAATYYVLTEFTNSTVPAHDAFTNALSFVGLWALARKYVEQWAFWIVVDAVCCYLYVVKGIPFKAGLYGLYVVIAVMGYFKWKAMVATTNGSKQ